MAHTGNTTSAGDAMMAGLLLLVQFSSGIIGEAIGNDMRGKPVGNMWEATIINNYHRGSRNANR